MHWMRLEQWSPYLCGGGIGILIWLSMLISRGEPGAFISYNSVAERVDRLLCRQRTLRGRRLEQHSKDAGWQWMMVLGIFIGAFLSAATSGQARVMWVPEPWLSAIGGATIPRLVVSFTGGALLGLGGRWAGGQGIMGAMQLSLASWVAAVFVFASGSAVATILYAAFAG